MKKNPFIARLAILTFTLVASSMPLMAQEDGIKSNTLPFRESNRPS
jgi:hypothetical protein